MPAEANDNKPQKLTQDIYPVSLNQKAPKRRCVKRRVRNLAQAHLQGRWIKGRLFYWYRRGVDKEIYLGSAEGILKAVKIASAKKRHSSDINGEETN